MKKEVRIYPVILSETNDGILVDVPDFDISTQGVDFADAIVMARDAIGLMGITWLDEGKKIPEPSPITNIQSKDGDIVTLVDVDFHEFKIKEDMSSVKQNCSIPKWLKHEGDKVKINYSRILQKGLIVELGLQDEEKAKSLF